MSLRPGDTLLNGQYRILRRIGHGGFAFVYHARDTLLGREVAIKELVPSAVSDPEWVKRFFVEARATIDLHHDHVVATHMLFAEAGNHYLVMEYLPGGSLEDALQKTQRLPVDEAARIARQVCEGLAYAHRRGIVHCDLKPANLLFAADGTAKVADFGIAHVSSHGAGSRHWATTGLFLAGTLPYMSPEQVEGERSDPRIDLYALGALLYQALTGRPYADFRDSSTLAAMGHNLDLVRNHRPTAPSCHNSLVPPWLDDVVLRLLAKRPEDRPGSAAEVHALLAPPAPGAQGPATQPPPPAGPLPRRRLPRARYATFGVLLVVVLGIALVWVRGGEDGTAPTPATAVAPATASATPSPSGPPISPAAPTHTPTPTQTTTPTPTRTPTLTPEPTHTTTPTPTTTPTATLTPTLTPEPTPTGERTLTPFSEGRLIAFASGTAGSLEICIMNVDDSSHACLTGNGSLNESPAWSPDGKRLAFHSRQDGDWEVYSINADGTEEKKVTDNLDDDGSPSWSPDGSRIAFDSSRDGNAEIYLSNADGSGARNLTQHPARDWLPAWSPDGRRLAFTSDRDGNAEIYVMNADGSAQTRLTFDPATDESPAWSPDGKRIAFFSGRDGARTEIYVMNADGSGVRRLTENTASDGSPAWSPDGKLIAFDTDRDGNWEIYIMNADGSGQANLTKSPVDEHFPAWGPE